jgi:phosphatidylglycerophosphate synthase
VTLSEIRQKNLDAGAATQGYVLMMLVRPCAPFLAWTALRIGLTPRQVTYLGFLLAWIIVGLASAGGARGRVAALLLVIAWELLDVADGTMARALARRDNFGGFLDYASGIVLVAFLPLALGVGLSVSPDGSLQRALILVGSSWRVPTLTAVVAGAGISTASLFMRLLNRVLFLRFGESHSNWDEPRGSLVDLAILNVETIGGLQGLVLLLAALFDALELALAGYFVFYAVLLLAFMVSSHENFRKKNEYYDVVIRPRTS